jgi:hypothetical protein
MSGAASVVRDLGAIAFGAEKVSSWYWWIAHICFVASAIALWRAERKRADSLSGRPDVTLDCSYDSSDHEFRFLLTNSNDYVAVSASALSISLPIPVRIIEQHEAMHREFPVESVAAPPTQWTVEFGELQRLAKGEGASALPYRVDGIGMLQRGDLQYVFGNAASGLVFTCPLVIRFSNVGQPKRTWHVHYTLRHGVGTQELIARYVRFEEVKQH